MVAEPKEASALATGDRGRSLPVHGDPAAAELVANLEQAAPSALPPGAGAAIFCRGTCSHPIERIVGLEIEVGGIGHRPAAFAMPRPDVTQAVAHQEEGSTGSYYSGFWGTFPVRAPAEPGEVELSARARLSDGRELTARLGSIRIASPDPPADLPAGMDVSSGGLIAVCMATFEPRIDLFRRQIESLRAQTDQRWLCVISDDCSRDECFKQIADVLGADGRFVLSRAPARAGFYGNFERALNMVPSEAELVALSDQDDRWHPDKLEVLRDALGDAQLVYSDQRLVDGEGRLLRESLWQGRRNNYTNLASELVANTITGASTLFRRELLEALLPFPQGPGYLFHDHWLGLAAMATGRVAFVERPLYDYVQHQGAILGHVADGTGSPGVGARLRQLGRRAARPGRADRWRAAYFYGYVAREVQARTLLVRCSDTMSRADQRVLEAFLASVARPLPFAWLALRPLRAIAGANETLGSETDLVRGIMWRWCCGIGWSRSRSLMRVVRDASLPNPGCFDQKRLRRWRANIGTTPPTAGRNELRG